MIYLFHLFSETECVYYIINSVVLQYIAVPLSKYSLNVTTLYNEFVGKDP